MRDQANITMHNIFVCTKCKNGMVSQELIALLSPKLPVGYALHTVECMAGCDRPNTIGFQAAGKASYLFGDIKSDTNVSTILEFAAQYQEIDDGWSSASDRPAALYNKTLARIPALKQMETV